MSFGCLVDLRVNLLERAFIHFCQVNAVWYFGFILVNIPFIGVIVLAHLRTFTEASKFKIGNESAQPISSSWLVYASKLTPLKNFLFPTPSHLDYPPCLFVFLLCFYSLQSHFSSSSLPFRSRLNACCATSFSLLLIKRTISENFAYPSFTFFNNSCFICLTILYCPLQSKVTLCTCFGSLTLDLDFLTLIIYQHHSFIWPPMP